MNSIGVSLTQAALLIVQGLAQAPPSPRIDRAMGGVGSAAVDSLVAAELRFFRVWGERWRQSEVATPRDRAFPPNDAPTVPNRSARNKYSCALLPDRDERIPGFYQLPTELARLESNLLLRDQRLVRGSREGSAQCVRWQDTPGVRGDESRVLDSGVLAMFHATLQEERARVIARAEAAHAALPRNDFVVGQLVRLLVDAGQQTGALERTRTCAATSWWCRVLEGYVLATQGRMRDAEAAFREAWRWLDPAASCRYSDVGVLFSDSVQWAFRRVGCRERSGIAATTWWLSEPLYLFHADGNARLVEHFVRRVTVDLHEALIYDGRYDWRAEIGGDATAFTVLRYGWPTHVWGRGAQFELGAAAGRVMTVRGMGAYPSRPPGPAQPSQSVFEYSYPRAHTVPRWSAVIAPFRSVPEDWDLSGKPLTSRDEWPTWWAREHLQLPWPLAQLDAGQIVQLRRAGGAELVVATPLDAAMLIRAAGDSVAATMFVSPNADSVVAVSTSAGVVADRLVARGRVPPAPAIISVEIPPGPGKQPAGRVRFGVEAVATLEDLAQERLAVSPPVLLRPPPTLDVLPANVDSALLMAAPTRNFNGKETIGVYFETYGLTPADSVNVAVWIERYTPQAPMRRLGIALGITPDLNTPVVVEWREPQGGRAVWFQNGQVPIIGRGVLLDVRGLVPGDYWLEIAVSSPQRGIARNRTHFSVAM
jgi:hypothetical protein